MQYGQQNMCSAKELLLCFNNGMGQQNIMLVLHKASSRYLQFYNQQS